MGCASSIDNKVKKAAVPPPSPSNGRFLPAVPSATPQSSISRNLKGDFVAAAQAEPAPLPAQLNPSPIKPRSKAPSLLAASKQGNMEVVQQLLEDPTVNIDQRGMWDNTPLLIAISYLHKDIAILLINKGATVDIINENGVSPLLQASLEGMTEVVELILKKCTKTDYPSAQVYNRLTDHNSFLTPLAAAAQNGFAEIVSLLLSYGAPVDTVNLSGVTALMCACEKGHLNIVTKILETGADVNARDGANISVLHYACRSNNVDVVSIVIQFGASIPSGLLWYCCRHVKNVAVLALLLEKGADPDETDHENVTPLLLSVERDNSVFVQLLLQYGAAPLIEDTRGRTALSVAKMRNNEEVLSLFPSFLVSSADADKTHPPGFETAC
eukprot:GILK01002796.1.p1 GENE.GILK01002796.1~~GILK01002796.1.p1  ORF type:complete len:384 (+),score=45.40 GILK01002796.1:64-1215(+)